MNRLINALKGSRVAVATLGVAAVGGISAPTAILLSERSKFSNTLNEQVDIKVNEVHGELKKNNDDLKSKQRENESKIQELTTKNTALEAKEKELNESKSKWTNWEKTKQEQETKIKKLETENKSLKEKATQIKDAEATLEKAEKIALKDNLRGGLFSWAAKTIKEG